MDRIDRTGERKLMNCGLWAEEYKDKIPIKLYNRLIEISNEEE